MKHQARANRLTLALPHWTEKWATWRTDVLRWPGSIPTSRETLRSLDGGRSVPAPTSLHPTWTMQKRKNPLKDDLARGEGVRQSGAPKSEKTNQNNKGVRHSGVVQCCCRAWLFSRFEFAPNRHARLVGRRGPRGSRRLNPPEARRRTLRTSASAEALTGFARSAAS